MRNLTLFLPRSKSSPFSKWRNLFAVLYLSLLFNWNPAQAVPIKNIHAHESATAVLSSVTVGSGGNYATLKLAFDAVNAGTITGNITIQIIGSTTETAMASLNASGTGLANYATLVLYPTGSGYTIGGNVANPIINLNGADNVVIDGRVNATGTTPSLIISNSSTSVAGSALRFINSAKGNTVRYATLGASGLSASTAVVYFSTASSGNGNDETLIEYCNITNNAGIRPHNGIMSSGTAGRENSTVSIRNNNFYNIFNADNNSYALNISLNSVDWTVSANSFYDNESLAPTGSYTYSAIKVSTPNPHIISGNYIGGSAALCSGSAWNINSSFATYFSGITLTGNTSSATLIQNNIIKNFNYSSTSANPWDGIYLSSGNVAMTGNIIGSATGTDSIVLTTPNAAATAILSGGTITAITLVGGGSGFLTAPLITFTLSGSSTQAVATANISGGVVTGFTILNGGSGYTSVPSVNINGAGYSTSHGIRYLNSGTVSISGNTIGSITSYGNAAYSHCFEGIVISGLTSSVIAVTGNLIGSLTTPNSIKTASPATASLVKEDLRGIFVNSALNSVTITGNTIANLTNANMGSSSSKLDGICSGGNNNLIQNNTIRDLTAGMNSVTVRGIQQAVVASMTTQTITGNTIYNLSNTHSSGVVGVAGIDFMGPTFGTSTVSGNFIYGLAIASTNVLSEMNGILLGNGSTTVANNIINLGNGVASGCRLSGINDNSSASFMNNNKVYFNTIYLAGTVSSGATSSTAALWNGNNTAQRNYRNNILVNLRTGGSTGKHYAIRVGGTSGLNINYNDYLTFGGGFLGNLANGTDKTTLASWKTTTSQDANSLNTDPIFAIAGGTNPLNYYTSAILAAATGTGITTDFTGVARSATPKMGALEITDYIWSGVMSSNFATAANWQNGAVPPDGSDISFAVNPSNHCVMDQNRALRNITNAQATDKLVLNGHQLTLLGNLTFSNSAKMDATANNSILVFSGIVPQNIPAGALVSNTLDGCVLDNPAGLGLNGSLIVTKALTLTSGNLSIGANTLTINGDLAATMGTLAGGSTSNITFGGSGVAGLPTVVINNLTMNRVNDVALLGSISITGTLGLTLGTLVVGANSLDISGNSPTRIGGFLDASHDQADLVFSNPTAIVLPLGIFGTAVNNLTLTGAGGVTSRSDFTANGNVTLQSGNPSATKGLLDMRDGVTIKTLTMGANATNLGTGDTTGIIHRASFAAGISYTLGSQFMKVYFANVGTIPTQLSLKLTMGVAPTWSTGAINRQIEVIQTGAVGTSAVVTYHYLDSELNGNNEEHLVLWVKIGNIEYGGSAFSAGDNWVSLSNVNLAFFSSAFDDTKNVTLDEYSTTNNLIWNGSLSTSWTSIQNWTPNVGPSATKNILIPNAATTAFSPTIPSVTNIKSLTIDAGGIVNSVALAQMTIEGTDAWSNGGTFNANTSNVVFNNTAATISGTTNFYNITINSGKSLSMTEGSNVRIAGGVTNNGTWNTLVSGESFIEYNGASQSILNPNGAPAGYGTLILSGSGTKTMNPGLNTIKDHLILADNVTVTATAPLSIGGNLTIGSSAIFSTGNFDHTIKRNFDNSGTFNAAAGHAIIFDGAETQSILGAAATNFDQLAINNLENVVLYANATANNTLTLTNGALDVGQTTLSILGTISKTSGSINVSSLSSINIGGSGALVLPTDLFNPQPMMNNLTINRAAGVTLGQNLGLNGVLNMTSGNLTLGSNNLSLGVAGSVAIASPSATKMIVANNSGELIKQMMQGTSFTFPVGEDSGTPEYTPLTITLAGDNLPGNAYGVKVTNAKHPNNNSPTDYLDRYWSISQLGSQPDLAAISASYKNADVVGTVANIASASLTGSFSQASNPWVKQSPTAGNTLSLNNMALQSGQTTIVTGIASANPTVSMTGTGVTCSGSNMALATTVVSQTPVSYSWTPPDFLSSTTIANPVVTQIMATTPYTVTVRDANGISANATGTVSLGNTTTWTGTWDDGVPTSTSAVVLSANYTAAASLSFCSLMVNNNAVVVIPSGLDVTLFGALTVNSGSFTLENNANLLQVSNVANAGNIIVKRTSSALKRQDYTLWSSPVDGQQLQAFSPITLSTRFYDYDSPTNLYNAVPATENFGAAKGYLIRMPNTHPTVATVWNGAFAGIPRNGNYSNTMTVGDATHRFNLVGNPYPSPLSMATFVSENTNNITGTLYFWRKTNNAASPSYCSWTAGTFVTNGEAQVYDPNGVIRTGQGFFVEAKPSATAVNFSNLQRVSNTANQFFRAFSPNDSHRIWLNATNDSGSFSQMEVGYVANATQTLDDFDGKYINDGAIALYGLADDTKLVIQGRALPFDPSDVVPLGFAATAAGVYTIALDHFDGLFEGDQNIFLKDHDNGNIQDLKTGGYTFTCESGTFDTRFELVYASALSNPVFAFSENQVVAYKDHEQLVIRSATILLESVKVFDARGRLVAAQSGLDTLETRMQFALPNGLLVVQTTSVDGDVVVKKVLW